MSKPVAIVTGGGSGIGAEVAHALADAGYRVCVTDINPDRADKTADAIVEAGGEAFGWQADVSNKFQAAAMIETTRDRYERLDVLVHAARIKPQADILTLDEWNWRRTVEVNLTGAFFAIQLAARVMTDEDGGHILALVDALSPGRAAYAATQAGVRALCEALNAELPILVEAVLATTPEETIQHIMRRLNDDGQS